MSRGAAPPGRRRAALTRAKGRKNPSIRPSSERFRSFLAPRRGRIGVTAYQVRAFRLQGGAQAGSQDSMSSARLTAVLGPTNTGKTHLAVTRMCGHASGMMGFPLRLLAREVYDRVVAIKGAPQVALVTGEEKIVPEGARYWLCTAEAMPADLHPEFLALDEIQLAADPERGHVFTDRLLHRRGTAETMLLGAATMAPLIRRLLPDAYIEERPRFSTLSYAGPKKLSRLPRRAALIAFSADEVYGLAEMLRRQKGGAAVVMGALSPRTRNAQVELYQSGEVDYLVATDAIGMGLNMDIDHVAFAALSKFDGQRQRRLMPAELGQIAGRAGRYQRDGTFGTLVFGEEGGPVLTPEEIAAVEGHEFQSVRKLVWRNARLDWGSVPRLIASLEETSGRDELQRTRRATDEAVLKALAADPIIAGRADTPDRIRLLWDVASLPDYRKTGPQAHARLAGRIYTHRTEGAGTLPKEWVAAELARLDDTQGGIEAISGRIAAARTWTYISQRQDWLADREEWAGRARALEDKLSDALHERLTQRFVDRRTSLLMRDLAGNAMQLPVEIEAGGEVVVGGQAIGTLTGFRFRADPAARAGEKKRLIAAAERHLPREYAQRVASLSKAPDAEFELTLSGTLPARILWRGARVARLTPGRDALSPALTLDRALGGLEPHERERVGARLGEWLASQIEGRLKPLATIADAAGRDDVSAASRGLSVQLMGALGVLARGDAAALLATMEDADRRLLRRAGVVIGVTHLFVPALLRPEPTRWRLALWALARGLDRLPDLPPPGLTSVPAEGGVPPGFYETAGFGVFGGRAVRLDMVERLAQAMHKARKGGAPFVPDANWQHMLGLGTEDFAQLMRGLGYRSAKVGEASGFAWKGRGRPRGRAERAPRVNPDSPFAALAQLTRRGESR